MRELTRLLPDLYHTTGQDAALQGAMEQMAAGAEADTDLMIAQLLPSTVSVDWGLRLWERAWGIPIDTTKTVEQRREAILGKVKGTKPTTLSILRGVAESFCTCPVELVEQPEAYHFVVTFVGSREEIRNEAAMIAAVNELRPAHLSWEFRYRSIEDAPVYVGAVPLLSNTILFTQEEVI